MDLRYEAYCFADRHFYDVQSHSETSVDDFSRELPELPQGWAQAEKDIWRHQHFTGNTLAKQGWKIHVSATVDNAARVLKATYDYCVEHHVSFKYLRTRSIVLARNSKYAPREGSGKLIAIYPADDVELERVVVALSALLHGEQGAYILSDLRIGEGPLYVRYGGFVEQWMEQDGKRVLAIEGPDGELVPDQRKPNFWVPEWVELPPFLVPHLAARNGGDPDEFPYDVVRSLHFSNGGGVYLATRKDDGAEVVLKEARPHAGLDGDKSDAVTRLDREFRMLTKLDGIAGIPQVYERFTAWEHHFLAMEHMPGRPLGKWLGLHYPLTHGTTTEEQLAEYRERALAVLDQIERTVDALHERGVVFADLHPLNVLLDDDDQVSLIDFELSFPVDEPRRPTLGAPGFQAPRDRDGVEIDEHPLAALRLWLFLPLNEVLELAPTRLRFYLDVIQRRFGLPDAYCDRIARVLTPRAETAPTSGRTTLDEAEPNWRAVFEDIATAILSSATPQRTDRLFPGDVEQFDVGGACFGYGAAGVLHALHASGQGRFPEYEQWLLDSVRRDPPKEPGFYTGAHGIAYVLENFGYHERATELIAEHADSLPGIVDHGLGSGLSGVALTLLHFADTRQDDDVLCRAIAIGDRLGLELATAEGPGPKAKAGLLHGWSGPALLFLRLFEHSGDQSWLDLSRQALERDLAECMVAADGSTQVRDGNQRTLPYVEFGGAGIALVLTEFARHSPDEEIATRLPDLLRGCAAEFVIHPGLMLGRAGLLTTLAHSVRHRPDPVFEHAVRRHLAALAWHAVPHRDGIAFPGMLLRRLSMDLNTGGAGILLALASVVEGDGSTFPFLGAAPTP